MLEKDDVKKSDNPPKPPGLLQGYGDWRIFLLRVLAFAWAVAQYPLLDIPVNWWPLHWVSWVPFLWAIHAQEGRGNLLFAYLGGTLGNLFLFSWIAEFIPNFSNVPDWVAVILILVLCSYLSIHWMLMVIFIPRLRRRFPGGWVWLAPALVVAAEFILPQIFPYMQGLSHYRVVAIFQLASLTGVYGITYMLFLSNCVVFHTLYRWRKGKPISWGPVLGLVFIVVAVLGYGLWRINLYEKKMTDARVLKVGLIQSNITPREHRGWGFEEIHKLYLDMSREAVDKGAQWVIWSEGEFKKPFNLPEAVKILNKTAKQLNRPILLGGFFYKYREGKRFLCNSALHVHPEKGLGKRYDKRFLVPFGEYKPFEKQLGFIYRKISHRMTVYPGDDPVVENLQDIPYAFLICYEAIFPSLVRESVNAGARLLVNITYDAWFGRTSAPFQHLMLASARSVENGIPMIRLGTTGISTVVDSLGRMSSLSGLFERQVLIYTVKIIKLPSLYSMIGDLFSWFCVAAAVLAVLFLWLRPVRGSRT